MSNWLDERFQCGAVCFLPPTSSVRVPRYETREFHRLPFGVDSNSQEIVQIFAYALRFRHYYARA